MVEASIESLTQCPTTFGSCLFYLKKMKCHLGRRISTDGWPIAPVISTSALNRSSTVSSRTAKKPINWSSASWCSTRNRGVIYSRMVDSERYSSTCPGSNAIESCVKCTRSIKCSTRSSFNCVSFTICMNWLGTKRRGSGRTYLRRNKVKGKITCTQSHTMMLWTKSMIINRLNIWFRVIICSRSNMMWLIISWAFNLALREELR